jgi:hypothetical protein
MGKVSKELSNSQDKSITLKSEEFKNTMFNSIKSNTILANEVKEALKITDINTLTKESLFDGTSITSKRFLEYLKINLQ